MNRLLLTIAASMALLAVAASAFLRTRIEHIRESTTQSISRMQSRIDTAERQVTQMQQRFNTSQMSAARTQAVTPPQAVQSGSSPEIPAPVPPAERPPVPEGPILTNAMRDVLVTVDRCVLTTRTLRCTFTATNQSPAEKKFVLGVGGRYSRFENDQGGASVFDDLGNDFLSAGGGIGNRAEPNCDNYPPCEVEKILTPGIATGGWLRFDNVDAKASVIKLLRLKWSDGTTWVPMDFRGVTVTRPGS